MSQLTKARTARTVAAGLLVLNLILLLFPPITWLLPAGSPVASIGYFVVTGVVAVASLIVMARLTAGAER